MVCICKSIVCIVYAVHVCIVYVAYVVNGMSWSIYSYSGETVHDVCNNVKRMSISPRTKTCGVPRVVEKRFVYI